MEKILELSDKYATLYNLPQWLVLATPVFFFFVFVFLIFLAIKLLEPKYRLYKEDMFHGLIWKWKWQKSEVIDLWCYCPTCKAMLYVDDENCKTTTNLNEKITFFICHACGESEKGRIKGGDRRFALHTIKRAITNKVRNKTYDIYAKFD